MVRKILTRFDVANFPFLPVRTRSGKTVGHPFPVRTDLQSRKRDSSVRRESVRIEDHLRLRFEGSDCVKHCLVLQAAVASVEVARSFFVRNSILLVVPEFRQSILDGCARWN